MFWHIETDIFCLIMMVVLYYDLRKHNFSTLKQDILFRWIALFSIVVTGIDIVASLVMDYSNIRFIYQFSMVLYFALQPILSVLWLYYAIIVVIPEQNRKRNVFMVISGLPYLAYVVIVLLNPIYGTMFTLGPNLEYTRGPFFLWTVFIFVLYSLLTTDFIALRFRSITPRSRIVTLLLSPVVVSFGIWAQLSFPGILVINASYTTVFFLNFYYIQNRRPQIDELTGVYRRNSGQRRIFDITQSAYCSPGVFLILDIDNFKQVNDTWGHIYGDETLKNTAKALKMVFPLNAVIARMGGDEFLVYLQAQISCDKLIRRHSELNQTLSELLQKDKNLVSVSMGAAFYPQDGNSFDELYAHADQALAQAKTQGKSRLEFYQAEKKCS